ncbi:MFS transporter [Petroclostridium sp. X23]|jgi:fucose permease|uniref:MFS transporter n=1 Tax=Petroclostridium sp. X23 TaxID=3045146 RepID=UPI0024AE4667|nr:MFS transporter [Petroclostridium sp. X23]WHH56835.1 MFS transporter [Petroclostridium sp. X23]
MKKQEYYLFTIVSVMLFMLGLEAGGFQYALLKISQEFSIGNAVTGMLVTIQFVGIIVASLLVGHAADRIGKKRVIAIFGGVFFIGVCLFTKANTLALLMLGVFVVGMGYGVSESVSSALLADVFSEKAGMYLNWTQSFFCLGTVVSPLIMEQMIFRYSWDWRGSFWIAGISLGLIFIPFRLCKIKEKANTTTIHKINNFTIPPELCFLIIAMVVCVSLENGIGYFIDTYLWQIDKQNQISAKVLSVFWLVMIPSKLLNAFWYRYKSKVLTICFSSLTVLLFILTLPIGVKGAAICFILAGIFIGPLWPMIMAMGTETMKGQAGKAAGIMTAATGLGGASAPAVLGKLSDQLGIQKSFIVLCIFSAVAVIAIQLYMRNEKIDIKNEKNIDS